MEKEPNLDKGKKIAQQIDEEDETYLKRDRFENEVIGEPSDEEKADIFMKRAQIEAPLSIEYIKQIINPCINLVHPGSYIRMHDSEVPMQMNNQWLELGDIGLSGNTGIDLNQEFISGYNNTDGTDNTSNMEIDLNLIPNVLPVSPVSGTGEYNGMKSFAGTSVNGTDMESNLGSTGSEFITHMDGDIPDYLSCIGSDPATSTNNSGTDTGTDTGTIFFIGSLGQSDTESSMENEMEWYVDAGSTGTVMSQNSVPAGISTDTNTGTRTIYFIGSPEQHDTEYTENQMEWVENVNELHHTGVGSTDIINGGDNINGAGRIHRTVTFQDLLSRLPEE